VQDVTVDRVQGAWLVQVDHSLVAGLRSGTARMIVAFADGDAAAGVGDVVQLQAQHLAGPQPTIEHQQKDRQVAHRGNAGQQRLDILDRHRPREPQRKPHPHRATHRLLPARRADERLMPIRHPAQRVIDSALHRVVADRVLLGCGRPVEEARGRGQHALHRRRRQQPDLLGRHRQTEPLRRPNGWHTP
jgi:hypothetical protein